MTIPIRAQLRMPFNADYVLEVRYLMQMLLPCRHGERRTGHELVSASNRQLLVWPYPVCPWSVGVLLQQRDAARGGTEASSGSGGSCSGTRSLVEAMWQEIWLKQHRKGGVQLNQRDRERRSCRVAAAFHAGCVVLRRDNWGSAHKQGQFNQHFLNETITI
jgi:hypothetical protein